MMRKSNGKLSVTIAEDALNVKTASENKDFAVKFEGSELPKIRRKVCRKIYTILMDELRVDKGVAKVATLNLEYRLNSAMDATSSSEKAYLNYVKNVINDIKVTINNFRQALTQP